MIRWACREKNAVCSHSTAGGDVNPGLAPIRPRRRGESPAGGRIPGRLMPGFAGAGRPCRPPRTPEAYVPDCICAAVRTADLALRARFRLAGAKTFLPGLPPVQNPHTD